MTSDEVFVLLDEAEHLLPAPGEGLPDPDDCHRLEEIADKLLLEAPVPRAMITQQANTIQAYVRSWTILTFTPQHDYQEQEKDFVRDELRHLRSVMKAHFLHSVRHPDQRNGIIGAFWNWLQS